MISTSRSSNCSKLRDPVGSSLWHLTGGSNHPSQTSPEILHCRSDSSRSLEIVGATWLLLWHWSFLLALKPSRIPGTLWIPRAKRSSFPASAPRRRTHRDAISKAGDWATWVAWKKHDYKGFLRKMKATWNTSMAVSLCRILALGIWRLCRRLLSTKVLNFSGTWQYRSYFSIYKSFKAGNSPANVPLAC